MRILLDHNLPKHLKGRLEGHLVATARDMGWDRLRNGNLLSAAEADGFDLMITGDQNLTYQQNFSNRLISLIVITQTKRKILMSHFVSISEAVSRTNLGSYELLVIPSVPLGIRAVE